MLWGDGEEEERGSCLLILRFAAAASATPQPVSWLQREASGRAWVTSGPGLSHRQRPGCPATRKGTKGTFDVQRPSSQHTRLYGAASQENIPAVSPPPVALPTSGTGRFSKASPRDVTLLHGRGLATLSKREAEEGVSLGISHLSLWHPPFSLWCCLKQGIEVVLEVMWKGRRCSRHISGAVPSGQCLCATALGLNSLLSGCQCELAPPGFKRVPFFKRGIYIPVLAWDSVNA